MKATLDFDPELERRIVAFSDELDRLGYSREAQIGALGGLLTVALGLLAPSQRRRLIAAHLAALKTLDMGSR